MPSPIPLFHAELLSNIRSITISIDLQSPSNASTKLTLSTPSQLHLQHDGQTTNFNLPACVTASASIPPEVPAGEIKLSYRLPVAPELQLIPTTAENYVPWSAVSLSSSGKNISLCCRACSRELVSGEKVSTWKDLPSGNWADMMDFWHCHKPETKEMKGSGERTKYSGLQGGYRAVVGTVLVELAYFLVAKGDCAGVEVEVASVKGNTQLCCSNCKIILGTVDIDGENSTRGWRLNKWNLKLQSGTNEENYPIEPFLSAQLLAFAEEEGIRRLIVSYDNDDDGGGDHEQEGRLKLWLFNTDIKYTSSETCRPIRAVKVFYQEVNIEDGTRAGQATLLGNGSFEEVRLVGEMVKGLRESLRNSTDKLLEELRVFGEWKVGALQRFEPVAGVGRGYCKCAKD